MTKRGTKNENLVYQRRRRFRLKMVFGKDTSPIQRGMLGKKHSKESRKKMCINNSRHFLGKHHSKESKRKISLSKIGKLAHNSKKTKENYLPLEKVSLKLKKHLKENPRIGIKNPNWRGGKSFEPYTSEFNTELKLKIKKRDEFTCQLCKDILSEVRKNNERKFLCVHHINYDKQNNNPDNLITLCNFCNSSVNRDRTDWTTFFQEGLKLR